MHSFHWLSKQTLKIKVRDRQKEVHYVAFPTCQRVDLDFTEYSEKEVMVRYTEDRYAVEQLECSKIIADTERMRFLYNYDDPTNHNIIPSKVPIDAILRNQKQELFKLVEPFFEVITSEYDPYNGFHPYGGIKQTIKLKVLRPI